MALYKCMYKLAASVLWKRTKWIGQTDTMLIDVFGKRKLSETYSNASIE